MISTPPTPLPSDVVPSGVRSRFVPGINGLTMHMLEAGYESSGRPCVLLLHGFPELAYSWRKVMPAIAAAGYHVIAPDQRGYGRTVGWDGDYDGDLGSFRMLNLVRDAIGLVHALGYRSVAAVIGHDFGSPVSAWCSLVRPDVFRSVVLMSAPPMAKWMSICHGISSHSRPSLNPTAIAPSPAIRAAFHSAAPRKANGAPTNGVFGTRGITKSAMPRPAIGVEP